MSNLHLKGKNGSIRFNKGNEDVEYLNISVKKKILSKKNQE